MSTNACSIVAVLAIASGFEVAPACANITWGVGFPFYDYNVIQMPDFDQLRTAGMGMPGLPNGGQFYCAPTALTNAAAYVNFHGYPNVMPVLGQSWGQWLQYGNTQYSLSNIGIELSAGSMGTNPSNGTSGSAFFAGAKAIFPPDFFTVDYVLTSPQTLITALDLVVAGVDGPSPSLVLPVIGFYLSERNNELVRVGGHVVTLTHVEGGPNGEYIAFADSSETGNDSVFSQSPFAFDFYKTTRFDKKINGVIRKMARVDDYSNSQGDGWLDAYLRITPTYGFLVKPTLTIANFVMPSNFEFMNDGDHDVVVSTTAMFDADFLPGSGKVVYLTKLPGQPGKASIFSPSTKTSQDSGITLVDPKKVTTGRRGEIYVLDGPQTVKCISFANGSGDGPTVITIGVPIKLVDLAYDDFNDRLVGMSAESKQLWFRPYCTNPDICPTSTYGIPPAVPTMTPDLASMVVDPDDGRIWLTSANLTKVFGLKILGPTFFNLATIAGPDVVNPRGIALDNAHNIMFESNGIVRVYTPGGDANFVSNPLHPMAGKVGGGGIVLMPRSRTNFDPAIYNGPGWNTNVLPTVFGGTKLIPCDADLDLDHLVGGTDLALLLGQWGGDGTADFNDDDVVNATDLAIMLGAWGPCQ